MSFKLKIALIQFQPTPVSPEANFLKAAGQIRDAAAQGSQIAVLPEYHLTSWAPEHPDFVASCMASKAYLTRYQALAQELSIHIVPGTIIVPKERTKAADVSSSNEATDFELCNFTYFIAASTGKVISTYQKRNLWHAERGVLTADLHTPHKAFDVDVLGGQTRRSKVRVGMLICWDLAFPEAFRELVADGAELIIIPAYWCISNINTSVLALNPESEVAFLNSVTVTRAYENTCAVAFCNSHGQSQVTMPILGSLGRIGADLDGMIVREIDLDVLNVAEKHYGVRTDFQGESWYYSRRDLSH